MAIVMVVINVAVFGRVFRRICVIRVYLCHCRCSLWWIEARQSIYHRMPITTLVSRLSPERCVDVALTTFVILARGTGRLVFRDVCGYARAGVSNY
jgi:hypothetical protein